MKEGDPMDPEYELIPQQSVFNREAYQIIERVLGREEAHKTLYEDTEVIQVNMEDVEPIVFWVGDP